VSDELIEDWIKACECLEYQVDKLKKSNANLKKQKKKFATRNQELRQTNYRLDTELHEAREINLNLSKSVAALSDKIEVDLSGTLAR